MKDFILLIREDLSRVNHLSEADFESEIQEYAAWVEAMSKTGNFVSGDPLETEGRYLYKDTMSTDGPFMESKEAISGYIILKAKDIEAATVLARKCPIFRDGGVIELRPILKM